MLHSLNKQSHPTSVMAEMTVFSILIQWSQIIGFWQLAFWVTGTDDGGISCYKGVLYWVLQAKK
jgi:hypothetical protein